MKKIIFRIFSTPTRAAKYEKKIHPFIIDNNIIYINDRVSHF